MKRLLSLVLLSIFLFNSFAYYLVYIAQREEVRTQMLVQIHQEVWEEKLIKISFDMSSDEYSKIEWVDNHEFRYRRQMYDVVKRRVEGENVTYFCLNDKQEENLLSKLDAHIKNHIAPNNTKRGGDKEMLKKIVKEYFHDSVSFLYLDKYIEGSTHTRQDRILFSDFLNGVPTPPPEQLFS